MLPLIVFTLIGSVTNVISSINKDEVNKYAIAKIIEKPEDAYEQNPKKAEQIETIVKNNVPSGVPFNFDTSILPESSNITMQIVGINSESIAFKKLDLNITSTNIISEIIKLKR